MTEEIAELVDIKDAVGDVAFESLGDDAPLVGLESIAAIITGVSVDSLVVVGGRLFIGGILMGGKELVTGAIESIMIPPVSRYDILTSSPGAI